MEQQQKEEEESTTNNNEKFFTQEEHQRRLEEFGSNLLKAMHSALLKHSQSLHRLDMLSATTINKEIETQQQQQQKAETSSTKSKTISQQTIISSPSPPLLLDDDEFSPYRLDYHHHHRSPSKKKKLQEHINVSPQPSSSSATMMTGGGGGISPGTSSRSGNVSSSNMTLLPPILPQTSRISSPQFTTLHNPKQQHQQQQQKSSSFSGRTPDFHFKLQQKGSDGDNISARRATTRTPEIGAAVSQQDQQTIFDSTTTENNNKNEGSPSSPITNSFLPSIRSKSTTQQQQLVTFDKLTDGEVIAGGGGLSLLGNSISGQQQQQNQQSPLSLGVQSSNFGSGIKFDTSSPLTQEITATTNIYQKQQQQQQKQKSSSAVPLNLFELPSAKNLRDLRVIAYALREATTKLSAKVNREKQHALQRQRLANSAGRAVIKETSLVEDMLLVSSARNVLAHLEGHISALRQKRRRARLVATTMPQDMLKELGSIMGKSNINMIDSTSSSTGLVPGINQQQQKQQNMFSTLASPSSPVSSPNLKKIIETKKEEEEEKITKSDVDNVDVDTVDKKEKQKSSKKQQQVIEKKQKEKEEKEKLNALLLQQQQEEIPEEEKDEEAQELERQVSLVHETLEKEEQKWKEQQEKLQQDKKMLKKKSKTTTTSLTEQQQQTGEEEQQQNEMDEAIPMTFEENKNIVESPTSPTKKKKRKKKAHFLVEPLEGSSSNININNQQDQDQQDQPQVLVIDDENENSMNRRPFAPAAGHHFSGDVEHQQQQQQQLQQHLDVHPQQTHKKHSLVVFAGRETPQMKFEDGEIETALKSEKEKQEYYNQLEQSQKSLSASTSKRRISVAEILAKAREALEENEKLLEESQRIERMEAAAAAATSESSDKNLSEEQQQQQEKQQQQQQKVSEQQVKNEEQIEHEKAKSKKEEKEKEEDQESSSSVNIQKKKSSITGIQSMSGSFINIDNVAVKDDEELLLPSGEEQEQEQEQEEEKSPKTSKSEKKKEKLLSKKKHDENSSESEEEEEETNKNKTGAEYGRMRRLEQLKVATENFAKRNAQTVSKISDEDTEMLRQNSVWTRREEQHEKLRRLPSAIIRYGAQERDADLKEIQRIGQSLTNNLQKTQEELAEGGMDLETNYDRQLVDRLMEESHMILGEMLPISNILLEEQKMRKIFIFGVRQQAGEELGELMENLQYHQKLVLRKQEERRDLIKTYLIWRQTKRADAAMAASTFHEHVTIGAQKVDASTQCSVPATAIPIQLVKTVRMMQEIPNLQRHIAEVRKLVVELSSVDSKSEDTLRCPVCEKVLNDPVLIWPCGDTVCFNCAREALIEYADQPFKACPCCRMISLTEQFGVSSNVIVGDVAAKWMFKQSGFCDVSSASEALGKRLEMYKKEEVLRAYEAVQKAAEEEEEEQEEEKQQAAAIG